MTAKTELIDCPKCNGTGYIDAFRNIANGVCFQCEGNKKVRVRIGKRKPVKPPTEFQTKMVNAVRTGDVSKMTYAQLKALMDFAFWHDERWPDLHKVWEERCREAFNARQAEKLAEFDAKRNW